MGNGAKHFALDTKPVRGHEIREGPFDSATFDPATFDVGALLVHLNDSDALAIGLGNPMSARDLALMVLSYWEGEFLERDIMPIST